MIKSFAKTSSGKALKKFFNNPEKSQGIPPAYRDIILEHLSLLHGLKNLDDLPPKVRRHELKVPYKGFRAINISPNWRLIFRFQESDSNIFEVDLVDYH